VDAAGNTRYAYTSGGQLAFEDGPWENDTVSYTYSHQLRSALSLQQPSASPWAHSYSYDVAKRHSTITSPAGTFTYTYPGTGHILAKTSPLHIKLALPPAAYITNTYDHLARLTNTALMTSGNVLTNQHGYIYDATHQRTRQTRTRGDYVDYGYDSIGQLRTAIGKEPGGSTNRLNEQFGYRYDFGGNLLHRTNNALIQNFQLNALNQVPTATRTGTLTVAGITTRGATNVTVNALAAARYADNTFAKDAFALVDGTNTFTAVGQDSLGRSDTHAISVYLPATNAISYDANGNTISIAATSGASAGQQLTFTYDSDDRPLSRIIVTNQWKSEFVYDAKVRLRIRKEYSWRNGVWALTNEVRYIYDGTLVLQERDGNNVPRITYTRGHDFGGDFEEAGGIGGLLARTAHSTLNTQPSSAHAYYHADASGNITALINSNQVLVASYLYDPFGKTLAISGPLANANSYRFSSMLAHEPSESVLYPFRAYAPSLQRWLTPEPYGDEASLGGTPPVLDKAELLPDGPNLYRFALNAPINYADSDGRLAPVVVVGGGIALRVCLRIPACRAKIVEGILMGVATTAALIDACRPRAEKKKRCTYDCPFSGRIVIESVDDGKPCPDPIELDGGEICRLVPEQFPGPPPRH
jgi:RHS repeat-associated protein